MSSASLADRRSGRVDHGGGNHASIPVRLPCRVGTYGADTGPMATIQ